MSTVAERLKEAHEHLLQLYTSIPILTPCLDKIKTNQAEFVVISGRLRQLQEVHTAALYKVEKAKKQLASVFNVNKTDSLAAYNQEASDLKVTENERRICLRQRDEIVTERYKLHKERAKLLEETRQLKKLNESVFDRSKDEVANADFPEELHWQLELKDYDFKIEEVRRQLSKYKIALSNLARAANLSAAALVAFLGYPEAAYKIWKVEYALKASQKMRLYLRVELSLSNAYSNEDAARLACPTIVPPLATPIKPSTVQMYFEPIKRGGIRRFDVEGEMRAYIAEIRSAHKTAEMCVAQETDRLNAMLRYRESIVPLLSKIRRRAFQDSCLGGFRIEGWEDEQGHSLLGTEADILVRGGIHEIGTPTPNSSSSQSVPNLQHRNSVDDSMNADEEFMNTRGIEEIHERLSWRIQIDTIQTAVAQDGQVIISAGSAPLSSLSPSNILGSEVLMMVDRDRQVKLEGKKKDKRGIGLRSRSGSRRDSDQLVGKSGNDNSQGQGSNAFSALGSLILNNSNSNGNNGEGASSSQGEREGRKRSSRGLFGFARSRRESNSGEDGVVPTGPTSSIFQAGRNARSSIDLTNSTAEVANPQRGHRRNVPSISISNHDNGGGGQGSNANTNAHALRRTFFENASLVQLPSWNSQTTTTAAGSNPPSPSVAPVRSRVLSMDEYIGIGPVADRDDIHISPFDLSQGLQPLIPSYTEHYQDQMVDPDMLYLMNSSIAYEGLSSLAERDEEGSFIDDGNESWGVQDVSRSNTGDLTNTSSSSSSTSRPPASSSSSLSSPAVTRVRSRSLSPHGYARIHQSISETGVNGIGNSGNSGNGGVGPSFIRAHYQHHNYSLSDQLPDGRLSGQNELPPPEYSA
ncbi:hypothetical protein BGX26_005780 [Mortierella sp. AD094]|nr:hypothetical protein BGX26_005780 [Mortierella sp. AD094]